MLCSHIFSFSPCSLPHSLHSPHSQSILPHHILFSPRTRALFLALSFSSSLSSKLACAQLLPILFFPVAWNRVASTTALPRHAAVTRSRQPRSQYEVIDLLEINTDPPEGESERTTEGFRTCTSPLEAYTHARTPGRARAHTGRR